MSIRKTSIQVKFLLVSLLSGLLITVGISVTYYVLTRQDEHRESRRHIRIAFDFLLDDLYTWADTYTEQLDDFLQKNTAPGITTSSYLNDPSRIRSLSFISNYLLPLAEMLKVFGETISVDRLTLYTSDSRLLVVYQRNNEQETIGAYVQTSEGKDTYLSLTDTSQRMMMMAGTLQVPETPLPRGIPGHYTDPIPAALSVQPFSEKQQFGFRITMPIVVQEQMTGVLVGDLFYTQDIVERYASLSQTEISFLGTERLNLGTLQSQTPFERDVLAQMMQCEEMRNQQVEMNIVPVTLGEQSYYQGRCAFRNVHGPIGALTISISQAQEHQEIRKIQVTVLIISVIALGSAVGLSLLLSRKPIQSMRQIMQAIETVAEGDFQHIVPVLTRDEFGILARAFNVMTSELREKQASLKRAEKKYRSIFENALEGIFQTTSDGYVLSANPSLVRIMGYDSEEEIISSITNLANQVYVNPQDRETVLRILSTENQVVGFETQLYRKDGTPIWVLLSAKAIKDDRDALVYIEGALVDITKRKQTEEELRKYREHLEELVKERTAELTTINAQLRQEITERKKVQTELQHAKEAALEAKNAAEIANHAKSIFLANMSHELRTPLNAILGFAQVMERSPQLSAEQRENLEIISHSGTHLLSLINDILDLSKIEAGHLTLHPQNFNLYRLLEDVEFMFRSRAEEKHLQLVFVRAPDTPQYIQTDEQRLRQILLNLLNNAIKFTTEGGVTVRIENYKEVPDGQSSIVNLQFSISDTGPGIAAEELDTLFDAFVQTKAGKDFQQGTGLGLAISRKFAQLMGGDMTVSSQLGRGTIFTFDISANVVAVSDVPPIQAVRKVIALEPGQPCYRLLIVDDNFTNRRFLIQLLSPLGFELQEAENGQEAIEIWEAWKPHLILMDMRMPVMNGYEATRQIKMAPNGQTIPIIAVTASSFEHERQAISEAGCDDIIRKPFKEAEIFEMLHKYLGVQYVYEESQKPKVKSRKSEVEKALRPETMAMLSAEWLETLKQAAEEADLNVLFSIITKIREHDDVLADALTHLADDFEYDKILAIIQQVSEQTGGIP